MNEFCSKSSWVNAGMYGTAEVTVASPGISLPDLAIAPAVQVFTFSLGSKKYTCSAALASTISPVLKALISENQYNFVFEGLEDPFDVFSLFIALLEGKEIDIDIKSAPLLREIGWRLNIAPLVAQTEGILRGSTESQDCIEFLKILGSQGLDTTRIVDYVATNWNQFQKNPEIKNLPIAVLEDIFSHDNFKPDDESTLFELIESIVKTKGHEFSRLFTHCLMAQLSSEQIQRLIDLVSYDEIPIELLESFDDRLLAPLVEEEEEEEAPPPPSSARQPPRPASSSVPVPAPAPAPAPAPPIAPQQPATQAKPKEPQTIFTAVGEYRWQPSFDDEESPVMNGVLSHIRAERPRDWSSYIHVTGGGTKEKMLPHILEFGEDEIFMFHWDNYHATEGIRKENAWLKITLPQHKLVLTNYTIATSTAKCSSQPKTWKLEGSNDGRTWTLLSHVRDSNRLKKKKVIATFPVTAKAQIAYTSFRLTQLENWAKRNAENSGEMRINAIEFYGTLMKL